MSGVAFFDLDRTILGCNSATLWVKRQVREGHMSRWSAVKMGMMIGLYQLGFGNVEDGVNAAIRDLEGQLESDIRQRTIAFWEEEVAHRIRPGVADVIAGHRAQGEQIVLLTGSSTYMSDCVMELLDLDGALCSRFDVIEGRFTGAGQVCYGAAKLVAANAHLAGSAIGLADCAFYTDSYTDLPVMVEVGRPVAVHPDPRLRRFAKREGWSIQDWGDA